MKYNMKSISNKAITETNYCKIPIIKLRQLSLCNQSLVRFHLFATEFSFEKKTNNKNMAQLVNNLLSLVTKAAQTKAQQVDDEYVAKILKLEPKVHKYTKVPFAPRDTGKPFHASFTFKEMDLMEVTRVMKELLKKVWDEHPEEGKAQKDTPIYFEIKLFATVNDKAKPAPISIVTADSPVVADNNNVSSVKIDDNAEQQAPASVPPVAPPQSQPTTTIALGNPYRFDLMKINKQTPTIGLSQVRTKFIK